MLQLSHILSRSLAAEGSLMTEERVATCAYIHVRTLSIGYNNVRLLATSCIRIDSWNR